MSSTEGGGQSDAKLSPSASQAAKHDGGRFVTGSLSTRSGLRGPQHPLMGRAGGMYSSEKPVPVDSTKRATAYSSRMPVASTNGVLSVKVPASTPASTTTGASVKSSGDSNTIRDAAPSQPLLGRSRTHTKESTRASTGSTESERTGAKLNRDQERGKHSGTSGRDRESERHGRVGRDSSRDRRSHKQPLLASGGESVRGVEAGKGKRLYSPHASPKRSGTPLSSQHSQSHTQHTQPLLPNGPVSLDTPPHTQGRGTSVQNVWGVGKNRANDSAVNSGTYSGILGAPTLSPASQQSQASGILPNYTQMQAQAFTRGVTPLLVPQSQQGLPADNQSQSSIRGTNAGPSRVLITERSGKSAGAGATPMILQRKPHAAQPTPAYVGDSGRRDRGGDGARMHSGYTQHSRYAAAPPADPHNQRNKVGSGSHQGMTAKADGRTHQHTQHPPPPAAKVQPQTPRVSQTRRACSEPLRLVSKRFTFVGAAAKKVLVDAGEDYLVVGVIGTEGSDKAAVLQSLIEYHTGVYTRASADDDGGERGNTRGTDEGITLRISPRALFLDAAPVSVDTLNRIRDMLPPISGDESAGGPVDSESSVHKPGGKAVGSAKAVASKTEDSLVVRKVALLLSVCHVVVFVQPYPTSTTNNGVSLHTGAPSAGVGSFCWEGVLKRCESLLTPLHTRELASVYARATSKPSSGSVDGISVQTGMESVSKRGEHTTTQNRYRNPKARVSDSESLSAGSDAHAALFDDLDPTSASLHPSLVFDYTNTPAWAFDALPKAETVASVHTGLVNTRWAFKGAGSKCYQRHVHRCTCARAEVDSTHEDGLHTGDSAGFMEAPSANPSRGELVPVQCEHEYVCCGNERDERCCHAMFMVPGKESHASSERDTGTSAWTSWVKRNSSWRTYSDIAGHASGRNSADAVTEQLVQTVLSTPRYALPERSDCVTWLQRTEHMVSFLTAVDTQTAETKAPVQPPYTPSDSTESLATNSKTRSQHTNSSHTDATAVSASAGGDGGASRRAKADSKRKPLIDSSADKSPTRERRAGGSKRSTGTHEKTAHTSTRTTDNVAKTDGSGSSRRSKSSGSKSSADKGERNASESKVETKKSVSKDAALQSTRSRGEVSATKKSKASKGSAEVRMDVSVDTPKVDGGKTRSKQASAKPDQKSREDSGITEKSTSTSSGARERSTAGTVGTKVSSNATEDRTKLSNTKALNQDSGGDAPKKKPSKSGNQGRKKSNKANT